MTVRLEGGVDPIENLRRDAELLGESRPGIRVASLSGVSVSLGVSQSGETTVARRARTLGVPVVHRSSGGSGLVHEEGDLVWSIVLPREDPRVGRDFSTAYSRLGAAVTASLRSRGLPADWTAAPGVAPSYCLLSPRGQVLSVRGRAIGGAAQHLTRRALLHHGTLNVSLDRDRIASLFDVPIALCERYLTCLQEEDPRVLAADLARSLADQLASWLER